MSVSVVVASRGTGDGVEDCLVTVLRSLAELDDPAAELVLALNGPAAQTGTGPRLRHPQLRVIRTPRTGAAHARNEALEVAANPVVLFTDDDCEVPPGWAGDHLAVLRHVPGSAAPIEVPHRGPITHYLDYKRIFIAPPLTADTCRYFVTANCGINRKLVRRPPRFDEADFNNAAEDAALGYRIVEDGQEIRWLGEAMPVRHKLTERSGELLERSWRYGEGNATLVDVHGRWQESSPWTVEWLTSILAGEWHDHRRFIEIPDLELRRAFTSFNIVETVFWLLGYLTRMQARLNLEVFAVDRERLLASLGAIVASAGVGQAGSGSTGVPDDVGYTRIAELLRDAVHPTGDAAAEAAMREHLHRHRDAMEREQARIRLASLDTWAIVRDEVMVTAGGDGLDLPRLELALRPVGVVLSDALSELEKIPGALGLPAQAEPIGGHAS